MTTRFSIAFWEECMSHTLPLHPSSSSRTRFARRRLATASAALSLMLGHGAAHAQANAEASAAVESGAQEATLPAELAKVAKLPVEQQARWLRTAARQGTLEKLDDATLTALFKSLDPQTVPDYVAAGPIGHPSYEFTMLRQERISGKWSDTPDHMLVKVTRSPLRVYAKWLPDGAHSGQEVIYDSSKRADEMYGHLGGLLGKVPMWTAVDGTLARAQSNHQVRDLGTEFVANLYLTEAKKYREAGALKPTHVEAKTVKGVRVVALTYETPGGRPQFYAKKETLGLDLRQPYFRTVESYDNDGRVFEKIVFEKITPKSLDETAFDPKNPDYKF
ncbi:DUF1571 domain-containing protein [Burkholderia pseudomallei]|uniref:DUF1571 domain-containing protein n=1 Tax=Burkholderia pseudomallei TaxID=28450 RepID=UPI0005724EDD|nr:DUF1571 domain-containing protein [Burkholderia pseudomallei]MBD2938481.1 DUF1571 domain-containing protein [Burkholderia pseudomallei]MBD2964018.1 DUF1571 domain-containing protein [Burkholderia pseudomallei]MBF3494971.1 DUF1571 domain-containing protein [Burkholderia pseudomallei]NVH69199.1 DUF1571 domain-containing protein [Burkholderia pseudomallei]OMZ06968.1 hypothetical protein AQ858_23295 [Burkholderia pseudomallei]